MPQFILSLMLTFSLKVYAQVNPGVACSSSTIAVGHRLPMANGKGYGFCTPDNVPGACIFGYELQDGSCVKPAVYTLSPSEVSLEEGGQLNLTLHGSKASNVDKEITLDFSEDSKDVFALPSKRLTVLMPAGQTSASFSLRSNEKNLSSAEVLNPKVLNASGLPQSSARVTVNPKGNPLITDFRFEAPEIDLAQNPTAKAKLMVKLNRALSQYFTYKVTLLVSGERSLLEDSPQRLVVEIPKGASSVSLDLNLSGLTSENPLTLTLSTTPSPPASLKMAAGVSQATLMVIRNEVTPLYVATYSTYSPENTFTEACSGMGSASRTILSCQRQNDGVEVDVSLCSDTSPTTVYKSPAGPSTHSIEGGMGTFTCAEGSSIEIPLSVNCNSTHYDGGMVCLSDTFIASFSSYEPENTFTQACSGQGSASRTMLDCKRQSNLDSVDLSFCGSDPEPSITYLSPYDEVSEPTPYGTKYFTCEVGSTVKTPSRTVCDYGIESGGVCPAPVYVAEYSAYSPENTFTEKCSGQATASREITSCTLENNGQAVDLNLCSDPQSQITYQSPAGDILQRIDHGDIVFSCAEGSTEQVQTGLVCDSGYDPDYTNNLCLEAADTRLVQVQRADVDIVELDATKPEEQLLKCQAASDYSSPTYCSLNLDVTKTFTFKAPGRADLIFKGPLVQNNRSLGGDTLFDISTASLSEGESTQVKISRLLTLNKLQNVREVVDTTNTYGWTELDSSKDASALQTCPPAALACTFEFETLKPMTIVSAGNYFANSALGNGMTDTFPGPSGLSVLAYDAIGEPVQSVAGSTYDFYTHPYAVSVTALLNFSSQPVISIVPNSNFPPISMSNTVINSTTRTSGKFSGNSAIPTKMCIVLTNSATGAVVNSSCDSTNYSDSHQMTAGGLTANTLYNLVITFTDQFGNTGTNSGLSFRTAR